MRRKTMKEVFSAGFLAGQAVVHSQSVDDQEEDYWKAFKSGDHNWATKVCEKYQIMDIEEYK